MGQFKRILGSIKEALKDNPRGLTITEIATQINLNRNSTARYLDVLLISGQVEMKNVGAAKMYFLSPRLPVEAVLDLSREGVMMLNSQLCVIRVNETFSDLAEAKTDNIIGMNITKSNIDFLFDEIAVSSIRDAIEGKHISYETTIQRSSGQRYLHIKFIPTTFDDGDAGVTIITEDITSRKETEDKLKKQSEFLNLVMESVSHPFYVIDANNYSILMANKAARLGALSSDSTCHLLTHKSSKPCSGEIHPCPLLELKASGKPVIVEHTHHTVSGRTRHLEIHAHPIFDDNGNVVQMIEYNLDITERKVMEENLQREVTLLRSVTDASELVQFVIQDDKVIFGNQKFCKLSGCEPSMAHGLPMDDFLSKKSLKELKKKAESGGIITIEFLPKGMKMKVVELSVAPLEISGDHLLVCSFVH